MGGGPGDSRKRDDGVDRSRLHHRGMVVVGAAGGAAYAQKPNEYQRQRWDVTSKMDSGPPPRVVNLSYEPFVQEGDRVRVFGNQLELVNP